MWHIYECTACVTNVYTVLRLPSLSFVLPGYLVFVRGNFQIQTVAALSLLAKITAKLSTICEYVSLYYYCYLLLYILIISHYSNSNAKLVMVKQEEIPNKGKTHTTTKD